ncbi:hypothetical protein DCC79_10305 [bacterium]|nr:class I SAM-dependent methyltransferase [Chloroflexi bacterium CFX6]RIL09686.1 MAG: hypothetical protein DCC79_10305 [bacterium]
MTDTLDVGARITGPNTGGTRTEGAGGAGAADAAGRVSHTLGMVEIRHVADRSGARARYDVLYAGHDIGNLVRHFRRLLEVAGARPGARLLDVACGEAGLLHAAAAMGVSVHGVDLSPVALRLGRTGLPGGALAVADGESLPFADASFDIVTNIGSLEHYDDPLRGVVEMARVLTPDGRACILVPNTFGLRWNVLHAWRHGDVHDDGQPLQRYGTRLQWARLLTDGGLAVDRVLGWEKLDDLPAGPAEWVDMLRHPSRWLIPLGSWLPVDMASMLVFVCRRAPP